ncbi:MAG: hypothetical protein M1823_006826, partial [Watsoniomyces obsoletus]
MIEKQKHEEDNAAAEAVIPSTFETADTGFAPAPAAVPTIVEESTKIGSTGLATPTQSPPPAPQPEPATLPENPPAAPATEVPEPAVVPLEQQAAPVPTPAEPAPVEDEIMVDATSPPTKVAREREEDEDEQEPAAKRVKTDGEQQGSEPPEFKIPDAPATASSPGQSYGTPPA